MLVLCMRAWDGLLLLLWERGDWALSKGGWIVWIGLYSDVENFGIFLVCMTCRIAFVHRHC